MSKPSRRGDPAAPHLYAGIPSVEDGQDFCPLKAFCVSLELVPAPGPRLILDGLDAAIGTINSLDAPADSDGFRFLAREEAHRPHGCLAASGRHRHGRR